MATTKTTELFTKRFLDFLVVEWDPNETSPSPLEQILNFRKDLLEELEIKNFSEKNANDIKKIINKDYKGFLKKNGLNDANDLTEALILRRSSIDEEEQNKYLDVVKEFQKTQRIENLYYFGDILSEKTSIKAENALKNIIQEMQHKNKAELLASISVYLEHIKDTQDGKEFINKLNTQEPYEWYNELFDRMNKSSPLPPSFDYELGERKIKSFPKIEQKTQRKGLFDGLYYTLQEDKTTGQLQISATSSVDSSWEKDSVARHALASSIINNALEDFFVKQAKEEIRYIKKSEIGSYEETLRIEAIGLIKEQLLVKDFTPHVNGDKNSNRNSSMAKTIQKAVSDYLNEEFDNFDKMMEDLTKSPTYHIRKKINKDDGSRTLTKKELKSFIEGNTLFKNDSYFVTYSPSSVSLNKGIRKTTLWGKVIDSNGDSLLSPEEFKAKAQYMALMSHYIGKKDMDNEAIEYFFDKHIHFRALNSKNKINNKRLENDKDFEKIIIEHFILENKSNISGNLELLDAKTSKNIEDYVGHFLKGLSESNYKSKLKSAGVNYKGDYFQLIKGVCGDVFKNDNLNQLLLERKQGLEEREQRLESEKKEMNSNIRSLNMALRLGDASVFEDDKHLEKIYNYFKSKECNGIDKKVNLDEYKEAVEYVNNFFDEIDCDFKVSSSSSKLSKNEVSRCIKRPK